MMYKNKSVLAIIPARGGSTGILRKNIKALAGKPLIAWTIEEAKKSKFLDRIILSSEDKEIINTAIELGCEVPFTRPVEIAKNDTPGIEPVLHALNMIEESYDYVVLLQPTSPLRKSITIDNGIKFIVDNNADSVISICEAKTSPFWMVYIESDLVINPVLNPLKAQRRQDLPRTYEINGALYLAKVDFVLKNKTFKNNKTKGFIMNKNESIDIDDMLDWQFAEFLLKNTI